MERALSRKPEASGSLGQIRLMIYSYQYWLPRVGLMASKNILKAHCSNQ